MAKKRDRKPNTPVTPTEKPFGGFKPLAAGLGALKEKMQSASESPTGPSAGAAKSKSSKPESGASVASSPKVQPHGKESQSAIAANRIGPHANAVASGTSDADDTMTFHRMMAGVAPLGAKGKSRVLRSSDAPARLTTPTLSEAKRAAESEAELAMTHLSALVHDQNDATRFEVTDDGSRVEGRRIDVPPALMRQLRRGMLPIDAKLDLHGHTASQAIDALVTFLQSMRARQERCVLVIHGKGERIAGSGVLRGEMAAWLSQGKARDHVAAFATARNADGGEGAIYILLRR